MKSRGRHTLAWVDFRVPFSSAVVYTATHCNTTVDKLARTKYIAATQRLTNRYAPSATRCNKLQQAATQLFTNRHAPSASLQHTATHCNTKFNKQVHTECNTLQQAATHCNTSFDKQARTKCIAGSMFEAAQILSVAAGKFSKVSLIVVFYGELSMDFENFYFRGGPHLKRR